VTFTEICPVLEAIGEDKSQNDDKEEEKNKND
jgi:hypothetical protein